MASREETGALRLNIKVNNANLPPSSQKFNTGSLRIPADPSWPKIPQRRLADDAGDVFVPSCVINLTDKAYKPYKGRAVVRPLHRQAIATEKPHSSLHREKMSTNVSQAMRRRPGCIDPRFKKVTIVKSQVSPGERREVHERSAFKEMSHSTRSFPEQRTSFSENVEEALPERNSTANYDGTLDESVKFGSAENPQKGVDAVLSKAGQPVDAQVPAVTEERRVKEADEVETTLRDESTESRKEEDKLSGVSTGAEHNKVQESPERFQGSVKNVNSVLSKDEDEKKEITKRDDDGDVNQSSQTEKDRNGQIVVMIKENVQPLPIGAIKIDQLPIAYQHCATQYYNVQVPILTYQNVPIQIAPHIQSPADPIRRKIPVHADVVSLNAQRTINSLTKEKSGINGHAQVEEQGENEAVQEGRMESIGREMQVEPSKVSSDAFEAQQNQSSAVDDKCFYVNACIDQLTPGVKRATEEMTDFENCERKSKESNWKIAACKMDNCCWQKPDANRVPGAGRRPDDREAQKSSEMGAVVKRKMKSEECLRRPRSFGGKLGRVSEPRIATRRRGVDAVRSKRATSFLEGRWQSTMPDSGCTLVWPVRWTRRTKRKRSQRYLHRLAGCGGGRRRGMTRKRRGGSARSLLTKLTGRPTESPTSNAEEPTIIPFETQQLLNKSYWEYYSRLKNPLRFDVRGDCQLATGATQAKRRKPEEMLAKDFDNQMSLSPPEMRTLERCTVLSSMINKTLDAADTRQTNELYLNENTQSSSDPTAGTRSALVRKVPSEMPKQISSSVNNKARYIEGTVDNRLLNLKTIVFFGSVMYILIVFLPMMHDYFFFEEYEDYDDLGYAELAIEYVLSSFQEAFGGIFDVFEKIFLRPRTCRKCKGIA